MSDFARPDPMVYALMAFAGDDAAVANHRGGVFPWEVAVVRRSR